MWDEYIRKMSLLLLFDRLNWPEFRPKFWKPVIEVNRMKIEAEEIKLPSINSTNVRTGFEDGHIRDKQKEAQFEKLEQIMSKNMRLDYFRQKTSDFGSYKYVIRSKDLPIKLDNTTKASDANAHTHFSSIQKETYNEDQDNFGDFRIQADRYGRLLVSCSMCRPRLSQQNKNDEQNNNNNDYGNLLNLLKTNLASLSKTSNFNNNFSLINNNNNRNGTIGKHQTRASRITKNINYKRFISDQLNESSIVNECLPKKETIRVNKHSHNDDDYDDDYDDNRVLFPTNHSSLLFNGNLMLNGYVCAQDKLAICNCEKNRSSYSKKRIGKFSRLPSLFEQRERQINLFLNNRNDKQRQVNYASNYNYDDEDQYDQNRDNLNELNARLDKSLINKYRYLTVGIIGNDEMRLSSLRLIDKLNSFKNIKKTKINTKPIAISSCYSNNTLANIYLDRHKQFIHS
jgi:hypothetical protein